MFTKQTWAIGLGFVAAFAAGGWVFTSLLPAASQPAAVQEPLPYAADVDTAQPVITLETDVTEPEDLPQPQEEQAVSAEGIPSQIAKIDLPNVTGIVSRQPQEAEASAPRLTAPVVSAQDKPVDTMSATFGNADGGQEDSNISMIVLPVTYRVIKNTQEYRQFKTQARGSYPQVNFAKQMLVVLESDSNFPDKVFEIESAKPKDGKLEVRYRVNVFGLDKKINTHSVIAVDKTQLPVELKQVL